jgi:hypothetical protein
MQDFDHTQIGKIYYWFTWISTMLCCKFAGFFESVSDIFSIELPIHEIKYLPQLAEVLPALIIAAACAVVSVIVRRLTGMVLNKFKFFSKAK